jgi:putative ABC transport system permease protein
VNKLRAFYRRLTALFRRDQRDADLAAELESHLAMHVDDNLRAGMTPEEARRQALIKLGGLDQTKESVRARRSLPWLDSLAQDTRFALRMLRKNPGFTTVAVLTLALGIGANTTIFSIVDAVLLKPLAIHDPDRVMCIEEPWKGLVMNLSAGDFVDVAAQSTTFESVGASSDVSFNLSTPTTPERVAGKLATAGYFDTHGVHPLAGRFFTKNDDAPGQPLVVVISEGLWRGHLGADPRIIGQQLHINGLSYSVVGIMPRSFDPYLDNSELWIPEAFGQQQLADRSDHSYDVVARLKPGVSMAQAQSELNVIAARIQKQYPEQDKDHDLRIVPLATILLADQRPALRMIAAAVGLLLLIACANIANLQLARARTRQREIAVRAALGASPRRIVRQLLAENIVLGALGGIAGLLVAFVAVSWIAAHGPSRVPRLNEATIDGRVLLFTTAVALLSSLVFGLTPALRSASTRLIESLKTSTGASISRDWVRSALVVSEFALALMSMASAGLFLRSALLLSHADPGFDASNLIVGEIGLPAPSYHEPAVARETFERIIAAANALPGVQSAALDSRAPMTGSITGSGVIPEGEAIDDANVHISRLQIITPGYIGTMRTPLKAGRDFTAEDTRSTNLVAIINETLSRTLWPGQSAIGKRFACCEKGPKGSADPVWHEVVGVVADVRAQGLGQQAPPQFYMPLEQMPSDEWDYIGRTMDLVVRVKGQPPSSELKTIVASVAPGVSLYQASTMRQKIAETVEKSHFETFLLTIFAIVALALSSVGIYGVLSFTVAQRTRDIGIRMALGASRERVVLDVLKSGMALTIFGLALGLAGALAGTRLLSSLLYGVHAADAITFVAAAFVMMAAAFGASYLPARRASRIDPVTAMRCE